MLLKFYMCRNRPGIVPMLATSFQLPDHYTIVSHFARHTMWFICIDIFKIVNWKWTVSVEIHNDSSLSGKWDQILRWIYEVIYIIWYVIVFISFHFFACCTCYTQSLLFKKKVQWLSMEACHYSYCLSTCFMQNYILSDCYIHSLEYPDTQLETRKCVMEVSKHRFLI